MVTTPQKTKRDAVEDAIGQHIGRRIRRRRRLLGLSQSQLGESVCVRFQQIQKYESGTNAVSGARLFAIAEALDVPVQYFYEGLNTHDDPGPAPISPITERKALDPAEDRQAARILVALADIGNPRLVDQLVKLATAISDTPSLMNSTQAQGHAQ